MIGLLLACYGLDKIPEPPGLPGRPDSAPVFDDSEVDEDCLGSSFDLLGGEWLLPAGFPDGALTTSWDTSTESPNWRLLDIDGDDAMELVVTYYEGLTGVGTSRWLVYHDDGTGFTTTATDWDLPTGFPENTFYLAYDASTESPNWGLVDLDGDGLSELVVTRYDAIPELGDSAWRVFSNTGVGFSSSGVDWDLPTGFPSGTFHQVSDPSSASPNWVLMDVDGDLDLDLVGTEYEGIEGLGDTRWLTYDNLSPGFSGSGDTWSLPEGFVAGEFSTAYDRSTASPNWAVGDLTGDGTPELVVTWYEGLEGVGSTQWMVYPPSDEGGFQEVSQSWPLPEGYADGSFTDIWNPYGDGLVWSLLDLDGDGALELFVHTETASGNNATVGTTKWLMHDNTGTGFSSAPRNWLLPNGYPDQAFTGPAGNTGDAWYTLADLDGDSLDDLIVTWRSDLEGVGGSVWLHYRNLCR
ncbi:MAG TPA: hypothetical protein QGF58_13365 [Myxococcota bacterium]|nr:hypothetical protein [Myxococcota bacterium]